jgi:hypothetical protein
MGVNEYGDCGICHGTGKPQALTADRLTNPYSNDVNSPDYESPSIYMHDAWNEGSQATAQAIFARLKSFRKHDVITGKPLDLYISGDSFDRIFAEFGIKEGG